jgi:hypothetical protein
LIESERKLLQARHCSSLCNKHEQSKGPQAKEFYNKILEAGTHLASMSSVDFPDAESVSDAIAGVLSVVEGYKLVGRWVTSSISNATQRRSM